MQPYEIQIIIKGEKADYNGQDITLNYEAPSIGSEKFNGGFSQMFRLPKTGKNAQIFEFAHQLQAQTQAPYRELPTEILINGVSVFGKAKGYLQEVTRTEFLFFVIQKETDIYQSLQGKQLSDFFTENNPKRNPTTAWKSNLIKNPLFGANIVYPLSDFGGQSNPYNIAHTLGAIRLPYLWGAVRPTGLFCSMFRTDGVLQNWAVSLKNGTSKQKAWSVAKNGNFFAGGEFDRWDIYTPPNFIFRANSLGIYQIKGLFETARIRHTNCDLIIRHNSKIIYQKWLGEAFLQKIEVSVRLEPRDTISVVLEFGTLDNLRNYANGDYNDYGDVTPASEREDAQREYEEFRQHYFSVLQEVDLLGESSFFEISTDQSEDIAPILPQISAMDFVKEMCQWFALTPLKLSNGTFHLKTLRERLEAPVLDWSSRFIELQKIKFTQEVFAQETQYAFKPTSLTSSGVLKFDNVQLPEFKKIESRLFDSAKGKAFEYYTAQKKEVTPPNTQTKVQVTQYTPNPQRHFLLELEQQNTPKQWAYITPDDGTPEKGRTLSQGTTPRPIVARAVTIGQIFGRAGFYDDLLAIYQTPKVITAQMRLFLTDVANFDFFKRIYIEPLGAYFLPLKIKYSRHISEVELLQITPPVYYFADVLPPED